MLRCCWRTLWLLLPLSLAAEPAWLDTAQSYIGVREVAPNRGPEIDQWNRFVGAPLGSPYCAAFVSYCLARGGARRPVVRSAVALRFRIEGWSRPATMVRPEQVAPGWILVWRRGATWQGHVGFAERAGRQGVWTVEANTTPGRSTPQREREGDGVFRRWRDWQRNVFAGNAFRLIAVTPVE